MWPRSLRSALPWLLASLAASAVAGEAPLVLQGTAAYHGLRVPLAVLAQTRSASLGDIQVLNARGEPVPHAWADEPDGPTVQTQQHKLPFFKAPVAASAADASQQGGWIIDTRGVKGALTALQLSLLPSTHGIYGFTLEYSNDLQQWRTHLGAAQLLSLQHQGLRLEHTRFELNGLRTRYLRLRPLPGSAVPPLTGAQVTSVSRYTAAAPMQWSDAISPSQCTAQYCDYTLPRHLPLERLQWQLADANTLAPVELLVQYDTATGEMAAPSPRHHHRHPLRDTLRDPLRSLRHKTAPTATPTEAAAAWHPLLRTTAYWLRLPEGDVRSPELSLGGSLVTRLRVQPVGGMVQLGHKPPSLRVGARAASLVFLAREPAPYRLAWGGADATSALTLAQLMPTRQAGDPLPSDTATVQLAPAAPLAAASAPAAAASTADAAPVPSRKFWLWAVLLAALGLMGFMAWTLLRPAAKP
jgi:hypothetical protein